MFSWGSGHFKTVLVQFWDLFGIFGDRDISVHIVVANCLLPHIFFIRATVKFRIVGPN